MAAVVVSVPNTCRPILSVSVLSHTPTDCMLICSDRFANTTKCYHCEHVYLHPPSLRRHNNILVLHILHEAIACMLIYREWFSNTYLLHKNQLWCIASIMQSQDTYIRLRRGGPSLAPTPVGQFYANLSTGQNVFPVDLKDVCWVQSLKSFAVKIPATPSTSVWSKFDWHVGGFFVSITKLEIWNMDWICLQIQFLGRHCL